MSIRWTADHKLSARSGSQEASKNIPLEQDTMNDQNEPLRQRLRDAYNRRDDVDFEAAIAAALPGSQLYSLDNLTEVVYAVKAEAEQLRKALREVTSDNDRLTKAERALEEIGRTTGCGHTGDADGQMQLVNCVQDVIRKAEEQRDELLHQVNALIESCYYRTKAGKVHWMQGIHYGTSIADNTDPKAFEEAMSAIRRNAGIEEIEVAQ